MSATTVVHGRALMALREINFDGIVGPSHNYAGLSLGNLASTRNAGQVSQPRAAALQGIDKMRANLALGLTQGIFAAAPAPRPSAGWRSSATTIEQAEPRACGQCHVGLGDVGGECGDRVARPRYRATASAT